MIPTKIEDFQRRTFTKKMVPGRVELLVFLDGQQFAAVGSAKARMLAFVSRADNEGFDLEIVEKGPPPYTDVSRPGEEPERLRDWQIEATQEGSDTAHRRCYFFEGEELDAARSIEVQLRVDGTMYLVMAAREPGYMGILLHKNGSLSVEVVEPKKRQYRDRMGPSKDALPVYPWQAKAIGLR